MPHQLFVRTLALLPFLGLVACSDAEVEPAAIARPVAHASPPPASAPAPTAAPLTADQEPDDPRPADDGAFATVTDDHLIIEGAHLPQSGYTVYPVLTITNAGDAPQRILIAWCPGAVTTLEERFAHTDGWCGVVETKRDEGLSLPPGETVQLGEYQPRQLELSFGLWDWSEGRKTAPPSAGERAELNLIVRAQDQSQRLITLSLPVVAEASDSPAP